MKSMTLVQILYSSDWDAPSKTNLQPLKPNEFLECKYVLGPRLIFMLV